MSTPASRMTATARAFIPCGSTPAEYASMSPPLRWCAQPSAIWLRQEFPVQRNRTFGLFMGISPRSPAAVCVAAGLSQRPQVARELGDIVEAARQALEQLPVERRGRGGEAVVHPQPVAAGGHEPGLAEVGEV